MICERCLMETNIIRPFKIVLRGAERSVGYLKFCSSCYHAGKFLDTISIIGFIALLVMLLYLILYGHIRGSNWIIYGVCIALGVIEIKLALYFIRNAGHLRFRKQFAQNQSGHTSSMEMVCYKDMPEKLKTITIDVSKLIFYMFAVSLVWFVYIRSTNVTNDGADPSTWYLLTHCDGGCQIIHPASHIYTDYVPYIALFTFSVILGLCVWSCCHVFFCDLINDIRTPTKDVLEKLKDKHRARQDAMKHADRKVFRDPNFAHVDNYMTYIVFGSAGSDLADSAGGEHGGQVSRVMGLLEGNLKSRIFGHLRFLHKAREEAAKDPEELNKTGPPPFPHR